MLPRKVIVAIIIVSLLLIGREGLSGKETQETPNVLFGFALVGAINAFRSLKELTNPL